MEIMTKYNVGDTVAFIDNDDVIVREEQITSIHVFAESGDIRI